MAKIKMDKAKLDSYITQIAAGDQDSFRDLYDYVKQPVYLFALSIVKNYHTAEEIMQETMMRVAFNAEKYKRGTNSKAWLFSIARNLCIDALNRPFIQDVSIEYLDIIDNATDPGVSVESIDEVLAALQILTKQEREIVSLYVYAGFSQVEIAKMLGTSYTKVRSQYGYATKKLRKYFER